MKPTWDFPGLHAKTTVRNLPGVSLASEAVKRLQIGKFRQYMLDKVAALDLVVFVTVRQDIFRWAKSKYHGDGRGKRGRLQFQLAKGAITREGIPKIEIDHAVLQRVVDACKAKHGQKAALIEGYPGAGRKSMHLTL